MISPIHGALDVEKYSVQSAFGELAADSLPEPLYQGPHGRPPIRGWTEYPPGPLPIIIGSQEICDKLRANIQKAETELQRQESILDDLDREAERVRNYARTGRGTFPGSLSPCESLRRAADAIVTNLGNPPDHDLAREGGRLSNAYALCAAFQSGADLRDSARDAFREGIERALGELNDRIAAQRTRVRTYRAVVMGAYAIWLANCGQWNDVHRIPLRP